MRVLIGCEESQAVCKEFRKLGHEAYSCDIQEESGGHPEWHFQRDVFDAITAVDDPWDIIILHPPCTALAVSGNRWYGKDMPMSDKREEAINWTANLWTIAKQHALIGVALENPVGVLSKHPDFGKPQYIQPWQFGHGETKKTGLWLHNLPPLEPTNIVEGREQRIWKMGPSPDRAKLRSKTFPGIARALAEQYGGLV
jgi:site-specific DNA-cytosine methylase